MVERYVYVKLNPEHATDDARAEIAAHTKQVITALPGVVSVAVGTPADTTAKGWDLSIAIRFDSLEDLEPYRVHPDHRAYVDDYLKPRLEFIKAWNFTLV